MRIPPLTKSYGKRRVLTFHGGEFEPGCIYAIIGPNGSGKSTFSKIAAGVLKADNRASGFVEKPDVGYMPQKNYAFKMSVLNNILLGAPKKTEQAKGLAEEFGLTSLLNKPGNRLSGGETGRMAMCRVLLGEHQVLILDEPTSDMDVNSTVIAENAVKRYARENNAVVLFVTHSLKQAQRIADEILFFSSGELVERGKTQEMINSPQNKTTKDFIDFYAL